MGRTPKAKPPKPTPLFDENTTPSALGPPPDFRGLLENPLVTTPLPRNFSVSTESKHLSELWDSHPGLRKYSFSRFVHAGGSGMVFKVTDEKTGGNRALKVGRQSLFSTPVREGLPQALSPVPQHELLALEKLSHPNIVRLFDAVSSERGVFAICTSYIEDPKPLDEYLQWVLERDPDPKGTKGLHPFSPQRLDDACRFLIKRIQEIASAIEHMHSQGLFHFDIKPANILISSQKTAIVTDLGACVHAEQLAAGQVPRVQFTWTYAHNDLTTIANDPRGISGGGLKATASVEAIRDNLPRFDLFSLGRTVQEALAILEREFGERCYSNYGFRFLHLIACLLLDGLNSPATKGVGERDGRRFVSDVAMKYPVEIFSRHRIRTSTDLLTRLSRFGKHFSWSDSLPELDLWQAETLNTGLGDTSPFPRRVAAVFNHPAVRRLRNELQLGWVREVYPGATHTRWSHSIGVFSNVLRYYHALLSDPEVPTLRIVLDPEDISHALVAAIIHDIGQTSFGHDFEASAPGVYNHEGNIARLLDDKDFGPATLRQTIKRHWPEVDIERVLTILKLSDAPPKKITPFRPVDGIASDVINGPIDADKMDYLYRDSLACGVPYGQGIDRKRLLTALSVDARGAGDACRLALAYRAKGAASIESLLLARYQMYASVYWHHTFRCIQAMFVHAVASTFEGPRANARRAGLPASTIKELFYQRVVCGRSLAFCRSVIEGKKTPADFFEEVPSSLWGEKAIAFVWSFADAEIRSLLERLARRDLFKRVFEARLGDLGDQADYSALKAELLPEGRGALSRSLSEQFLKAVRKAMAERGPIESMTENEAKKRYDLLKLTKEPLVVLDFPVRGLPEEKNMPNEIGDPERKYLSGHVQAGKGRRNVFNVVRQLQIQIASVRIFAAPELHELIVRYLDPMTVQECVESVIPRLRIQD